eukprot:GHVU01105364.1.p1 GENE.GHVU01105364.1~~GHVU01105364.1.p1  ORF type:complete len:141 (-),score=11.90 GHVU01105364.1:419-841(-)
MVVKRLIDVIVFLGERGLAFRGGSHLLGVSNNGNYLGMLDLLAKYDSSLAQHIEQYANKGRGAGNVSYFSNIICDELIDVIGSAVQSTVLERLRKAKYYSMTVDSTADCARVDQLTVIVRYLEGNVAVERFLTFFAVGRA